MPASKSSSLLWLWLLLGLGAGALLVVVLCAGIGYWLWSRSAGLGSPPTNQAAMPPIEQMPLTDSFALPQAYEDNALSADRQYSGKWYRVGCSVLNIEKEGDRYYVAGSRWTPARYPAVVKCYVDPRFLDDFKNVQTQDGVIVAGIVRGLDRTSSSRVVVVDQCRLLKHVTALGEVVFPKP